MLELIKKEVPSAIKWTWVVVIAASAYYLVVPKYQVFQNEEGKQRRLNQVTGQVYYPPTQATYLGKNKNGFWIIESENTR